MEQPQNVIFWSGGATAALGIRTTDGQTDFINRITGADAPGKALKERVAEVLGRNGAERWHAALFDLIHHSRGYAKRIGVDGLAPHDLRRTCARLCHGAGGELEQIQFPLGHASVQTTERYIGCRQNFREAVNDRFQISLANNAP